MTGINCQGCTEGLPAGLLILVYVMWQSCYSLMCLELCGCSHHTWGDVNNYHPFPIVSLLGCVQLHVRWAI